MRLTRDAAMAFRVGVVDILGDTCCFVIAALLFPDMEPGPAIVAEAKRSNVQVLWGTDKLMDRLAEVAASKDLQVLSILEPWAPGGVPVGPRRRGRNFPFPTTGRPHGQPSQTHRARASGPKPGRPHPTVAPIPNCPVIWTQGDQRPRGRSPHRPFRYLTYPDHPDKEPFANETPPASPISPRAHHPQRASAPGPAHAKTPTPRHLN